MFQYAELKRLTSDVHPTLDYISILCIGLTLYSKTIFPYIFFVFKIYIYMYITIVFLVAYTHTIFNNSNDPKPKNGFVGCVHRLDQLLPFS